MIYRTVHTTRYRYDQAVLQSISEARLMPRSTKGQRVLETSVSVQPDFATHETRKDYFGNDVTTITVFGMHDRFTVTATSVVETGFNPSVPDSVLTWEETRAILAAPSGNDDFAASEFTFSSPFVSAVKAVTDFVLPTFWPGRSLVQSLKELNYRIATEFLYKPESTSIGVPLEEVMEKRHGVCQDFAHIMIGGVRSLGLAARYMSGYLRSDTNVLGAEASHAWVSVYVPGAGWMDFDPTNNVIPSDGHVTVGWGRDYGDVTPLKGVALGGGGQKVDVEVRVTPLENAAA